MQRFALFDVSLEGINLVESSAGTGKTYTITGLYVRAVAEVGLMPSEILVVTFTKAATQELRERIGRRIREAVAALESEDSPDDAFLADFRRRFKDDTRARENLNRALDEIDLAAINTIHSFCQQALQEYVFESNSHFDTEYSGDDSEMLTEAVDSLWREEISAYEKGADWRKPLCLYLMDKIKTPENLKKILEKIKGKPYIRYSVDPDEAGIKKQFDELNHDYGKCVELWDENEIRDRLLNTKMNKNSYSPDIINRTLEVAGSLIESGVFPLNMDELKDFDKLKPENLQKGTNKGNQPPEHPFFDAFERLLNADFSYIREAYLSELAQRFLQKLESLKSESRVRSFDDILIGMMNAVQDDRMKTAMRNAYPLALVDEFQDTDPVQVEIFREIYDGFPGGCLFLIGDPKQSIYRFRGADIHSYLYMREHKEVRRFTLDKNYRSSKGLVQAVNHLFSVNEGKNWPGKIEFQPSAAHKENDEFVIPDAESDAAFHFLYHENKKGVNKADGEILAFADTASEIARLIKLGQKGEAGFHTNEKLRPLQPGDIAILVQKHSEAVAAGKLLLKLGIKSVHKSRENVFKSGEAVFLLDLLGVIRNPGYTAATRHFLFTGYIGAPLSRLEELSGDAAAFSRLTEELRLLRQTFEDSGFMPMLQNFLKLEIAHRDGKSCTVEERVLSMDSAERRYTNLMHLAELISDYEREEDPGLEELHKWLLQKKEAPTLEETEIRLDSDDKLVQILTIHSSKGLEFPVVFCPSLWHYGEEASKIKPPLIFQEIGDETCVDFTGAGGDTVKLKAFEEDVAERIRLTYVALTRARCRCYVSVIPYKSAKRVAAGPLTFVMSDPETRSEFLDRGPAVWNESYAVSQSKALAETHPELFFAKKAETESSIIIDRDAFKAEKPALKFTRDDTTRPSWFMTSYSGLKKHAGSPEQAFEAADAKIDETQSAAEPDAKNFSIKNFPKGAHSGIFMHQIFEDITFTDFRKNGPALIEQYLADYDFNQEYADAVIKMTRVTLNKTLPGSGAALSDITNDRCLKEMEFYFALCRADVRAVAEIISGGTPSLQYQGDGFMTGFIDLVFEHNGKYYILDYKSDTLENYQPEPLELVMQERGYLYQYYIYTVALVRFLKQRLGGDFDYETHIGGAYYLFLRGIEKGDDSKGIFFDLPDRKIVEALDRYFEGGSHAG